MVCTGTTREQLLETLERLEERGVENVLALRGDPPRDQPEWRPVPGGFRHASELAAFIRERFDFCLGGACYPEKHHEAPSLEEDLRHLREKVEAGVEFLITQVFFDGAVYWRFVERVRALGIDVPIVPGIMPLRDLASLERIVALSPGTSVPAELRERLVAAGGDAERALAEGAEWAARQVRGLLDGGAPGIHYYTLNLSPSTLRAHALATRR
jgi:methylenetetrahydrofolate reductase (NADPH)